MSNFLIFLLQFAVLLALLGLAALFSMAGTSRRRRDYEDDDWFKDTWN